MSEMKRWFPVSLRFLVRGAAIAWLSALAAPVPSPLLAEVPTPTPTVIPFQCVGDCNQDWTVDIEEIIRGTAISLRTQPIEMCPSLDPNWRGQVTVGALVLAERAAFDGCPLGMVTGPPLTSSRALPVHGGAGLPGTTVPVTVSLRTEGARVVGVQNALGFSPDAPVLARPFGTTLSQAVGYGDTAIPVADASAFPDLGTVIIDSEVISYSRIDGNDLLVGGCRNMPGGANVSLSCKTDGECGGGTCAPLGRGAMNTMVVAHSAGAAVNPSSPSPDCRRNEALTGVAAAFAFTNLACYAAPPCGTPPCPPLPACSCNAPGAPSPDPNLPACDGVAAVLLTRNNLDTPLPDGLLFRCNVTIPSQAVPGTTYPLSCPSSLVSTPDGTVSVSTCSQDAVVIAVTPTFTATHTPTVTSTATSTATPTSTETATRSATPTLTSTSATPATATVNPSIPAPTTTPPVNVTGEWSGPWTSDDEGHGSVFVVSQFQQDGNAVSGEVTVTDSDCLSHGSVSAVVSGAHISGTVTDDNGYQVDFEGTVESNRISGTYYAPAPPCGPDDGTFDMTRANVPLPTPTPTPGPCYGDCNENGQVTVDEVMQAVDMALGRRSPSTCPLADTNQDGVVTVDEVVQAVNAAMAGCVPIPSLLRFVGFNGDGITQADSVNTTVANVDVCQDVCPSCTSGAYTETSINAVFENKGKADIYLDSYTVEAAPETGVSPVRHPLTALIPGGRCDINTALACATPEDCPAAGEACTHSQTTVNLLLYDFDFKERIRLGVCPDYYLDSLSLQCVPSGGAVVGQTLIVFLSFTGIDLADNRHEVSANYLTTFDNFASCGG